MKLFFQYLIESFVTLLVSLMPLWINLMHICWILISLMVVYISLYFVQVWELGFSLCVVPCVGEGPGSVWSQWGSRLDTVHSLRWPPSRFGNLRNPTDMHDSVSFHRLISLSPSLSLILPLSSYLSPSLPKYQLKWGGHAFIFSSLSAFLVFPPRSVSVSHFLSLAVMIA